jgi:hypothetical protein
VEVIDEGFDLVGLEDGGAGMPPFGDAEIGAQIPTVAVDAVAVFAASFMKEGRSDGFAFSRMARTRVREECGKLKRRHAKRNEAVTMVMRGRAAWRRMRTNVSRDLELIGVESAILPKGTGYCGC